MRTLNNIEIHQASGGSLETIGYHVLLPMVVSGLLGFLLSNYECVQYNLIYSNTRKEILNTKWMELENITLAVNEYKNIYGPLPDIEASA